MVVIVSLALGQRGVLVQRQDNHLGELTAVCDVVGPFDNAWEAKAWLLKPTPGLHGPEGAPLSNYIGLIDPIVVEITSPTSMEEIFLNG